MKVTKHFLSTEIWAIILALLNSVFALSAVDEPFTV